MAIPSSADRPATASACAGSRRARRTGPQPRTGGSGQDLSERAARDSRISTLPSPPPPRRALRRTPLAIRSSPHKPGSLDPTRTTTSATPAGQANRPPSKASRHKRSARAARPAPPVKTGCAIPSATEIPPPRPNPLNGIHRKSPATEFHPGLDPFNSSPHACAHLHTPQLPDRHAPRSRCDAHRPDRIRTLLPRKRVTAAGAPPCGVDRAPPCHRSVPRSGQNPFCGGESASPRVMNAFSPLGSARSGGRNASGWAIAALHAKTAAFSSRVPSPTGPVAAAVTVPPRTPLGIGDQDADQSPKSGRRRHPAKPPTACDSTSWHPEIGC